MRILKAEIVGHFGPKGERYAVYSMDVQPNSNRLATGGGDFCVKLWNFDALLSTPENAKEALLATLSSHTKSVNVVRWSKDGKLLASGSDDNYILVHRYTPGAIANQTFGSSSGTAKNKETWSRCYTLQGHSMDILDLDWLPGSVENGYTLASASVDNRIMVWNLAPAVSNGGSHAMSTQVSPKQILSGHHSFVKGLSYDPMGRYLLSSGSDNRLIVWDIQNDYAVVRTLDEPLRNSPDKTIFRRISWAPDGQSVCITSAQKSNKPVGMVLKRGTWESVADLVGHAASSISAKFCPHVLQYSPPGADGSKPAAVVACTVALGDQNGVVSIWSTHSNRPLYVLRDVCDGAVTDMTWARVATQTIVAMCGIDGSVVLVDLEGEIGKCMPQTVLEKHFQSLYGRNAAEMQQRPQALVESALALKYAQSAAAPPLAPVSTTIASTNAAGKKRIDLRTQTAGPSTAVSAVAASPMSSAVHRSGSSGIGAGVVLNGASPASPSTLQLQQMSHTIGGKKRIRPVLMQNNLDTPDEVTAAVVGGSGSALLSTASVPPLRTAASSGSGATVPYAVLSAPVRDTSAVPVRVPDYQPDNSGGGAEDFGDIQTAAKRARPASEALVRNSSAQAFAAANSTATIPVGRAGLPAIPSSSAGVASGARQQTAVSERFLTIHFDHDETLCTVPLLNAQQRIRKTVASALPAGNASTYASGRGLGAMLPAAASGSGASRQLVVTAQRLTKPSVLAQLRHSGGPLSALTLSTSSAGAGAAAGVTPDGALSTPALWTAVVAGEVTCIAAAQGCSSPATGLGYDSDAVEGLCLLGCSDGTLHCVSLSCGMRVGPPMVLGCALAYVDIRIDTTTTTATLTGNFVALGVTADGEVWKWSIDAITAKFRCLVRTSLRPVLLSMKCQATAHVRSSDKGSERFADSASKANAQSGTNSNGQGPKDRSKGSSSGGGVGTSSRHDQDSKTRRRGGPGGVSVRVQQCLLTEQGDIQVHLQCAVGIAEGGAWQAFSYDADAMVWQRLADLRHVLSSLFAVKALGTVTASPIVYADTVQDGNASAHSAESASGASLNVLQSVAATQAGFGARDVVSIAAAKQAALHAALSSSIFEGTANGTSSYSSANGAGVGSGVREVGRTVASAEGRGDTKVTPSTEEWVSLATISHVEDRLAVAQALGSAVEVEAWLVAWIETCCKNGLDGRLRWLTRKLVELHHSSTTAQPVRAGGVSHQQHQQARSSSCWEWLASQPQPLVLLQEKVMPVIAKFPAAHALLAEINHTLEMLALV